MSDLRLTFCGDDFTGSTDVLEALATAGLRTVLFLEPPTREELRRFGNVQAAGVASTCRTLSPEDMESSLRPALEGLRALGAPLCHYKVCSTFDSSPRVGSIGRAIDIGSAVFGGRTVPLVVGAPVLRRYCAFGNLFATMDGATHRIDRHPVMSRHPVTPMDEGDLRLHLSRQTTKRIALMDLLQLSGTREEVDRRYRQIIDAQPEILLFDVLDDDRLAEVGRLVWSSGAPFAVGSSGIEYALTAAWRRSGELATAPVPESPGPASRILVVSGSCSDITRGQIEWAVQNGFQGIRVAPDGDETALVRLAREAFDRGLHPVLYTAMGPDDAAIQDARSRGSLVGARLGRLTRRILEEERLTRLLVAGGDTSGHVARELGLYALEMAVPIAPGSPLCRSRARNDVCDGLEIAMKGGQVGKADYFASVLRGAA
jgi:uncharacterized protein YgbK (DUF1537 family)